MKQFFYHDYYYLDTFLLPTMFFIAFLITMIKWKNRWLFYGIMAILYFVLSWEFQESYIHVQRTKVEFHVDDLLYQRKSILSDMKQLIEKNNIEADKIINFPDPIFPFNIAQVNLKRRGYWDRSEFNPEIKTTYLHLLSIRSCDYMLITEKYLNEKYKNDNPDFDQQLIFVDKYNSSILFKYKK
jgi:hypothetical protein